MSARPPKRASSPLPSRLPLPPMAPATSHSPGAGVRVSVMDLLRPPELAVMVTGVLRYTAPAGGGRQAAGAAGTQRPADVAGAVERGVHDQRRGAGRQLARYRRQL